MNSSSSRPAASAVAKSENHGLTPSRLSPGLLKLNTRIALLLVSLSLSSIAQRALATDYRHNTDTFNWSLTIDWTPAAPAGGPNAAGDIVRYGGASNVVTTQDTVGGVTIGQIILDNAFNTSWTITPTTAITLNNNGAGAVISNTDSSTSTTPALILAAGTLTLADNLTISNTGGSTNALGAVQISSAIGGTGNVTLSNVKTAISATGAVRLSGANTFTGGVLVQKGTITIGSSTAFGNSANAVTLGQAGQGSAAILSTTNVAVANNITVSSGTGGTLSLGSTSTSNATNPNVSYTGTITLNGSATLISASPVANPNVLTFSGRITGAGGIAASASGASAVAVQLTGNNDFAGTTTINNLVTLRAAGAGTNQSLGGTSGVTINNGGTLLLGSSNQINDAAGVTLNGAGTFNTGGFTEGTRPSSPVSTDGVAGMGALTLSSTSSSLKAMINFATGANGSSLVFSSLSGGTGAFVNVLNWSGTANTDVGTSTNDRLLFAADPGLTDAQLANWQFFNDAGTAFATGATLITYGNEFELVPVPEPSTWAAGLLALAALAYSQRKRLRKTVKTLTA